MKHVSVAREPADEVPQDVAPADGRLPDWAFKYAMVCFVLYAFRDALTGSLRFYLQMVHLSVIWFIPDLLAVGCFVFFITHVVRENRSIVGAMFVVNFLTAAMIAAIFMNERAAVIVMSIKCVLPIFAGICLTGRSVTEQRGARYFLLFIIIVTMIGVIVSSLVTLPWEGVQLNNFGFAKVATKIWWAGGGRKRYGGFAGDSTMAAFMALYCYVLIFRNLPRWINVALWPCLFYALYLTNSKTAILVFSAFVLLYVVFYMTNRNEHQKSRRRRTIVRIATASFICVPIPFVLMFVLGGVDLSLVSPQLASLQDRINNTWTLPFTNIADLFPAGLITGCGLGCYSYPMLYTELVGYWQPLDNFYLSTYLMLGVPFLIMVLYQATSMDRVRDETKLVLILLINLYTVTVQCYGPSFATVMVGYTFSDLFLRRRPAWRRASGRGVPSARRVTRTRLAASG